MFSRRSFAANGDDVMDDKKGEATRQGDSAAAASSEECCPPAGVDADCCGPKRRSWVKTLVFVAVMSAAVGVGGYSLWKAHGSTAEGTGRTGAPSSCCDKAEACGDEGTAR